MINLNNLNEPQKQAVISNSKQILTIAGAGSGKTRVLTMRIARLISEGTNPDNILALTFTNKASKEMKERITSLTGIDESMLNVMTFHSFCNKVLRRYISLMFKDFNSNFKILDADDTKKLCKECIDKINEPLEESRRVLDIKMWENYIEKRNRYEFYKEPPYEDKYIEAFTKLFNKRLTEMNSLTFDDLQIKAYKVLKYNDKARYYYQNLLEYVLVDEFQDTDSLQYKILNILIGIHHNLFVVGDDFQSIYGFRNADYTILLNLKKDFPDLEVVKLEQNYRSTPEIIEVANSSIKLNTKQIDKTLFTNNSNGERPQLITLAKYQYESEFITEKIKELHNQGYNYKDIAILYRVNSLSRCFEDEFIKKGIPYVIHNGTSFYLREEIKDIIAFLYLLANEDDNESLKRIINKPARSVGNKTLEILEQINKKDEYDPFDDKPSKVSLYKNIDLLEGSKAYVFTLKDFKRTLESIKRLYFTGKLRLIDTIEAFLNDLNYYAYVSELQSKTLTDNNRFANIEEFKTIIYEYEEKGLFESAKNTKEFIFEFLQELRLDNNDETEEKNAVNLMTIHSSKGLEFKAVFLPALEKNIFPSPLAHLPDEIEEERRLFYVAVTRAKEKLYLSCARERFLNGRVMLSTYSEFISEVYAHLRTN